MESDGSISINYTVTDYWKYDKFAHSINNMLLRRDNVDLNTFRMRCDHNHIVNCKDVRTWIGYAIKHNVKILDVVMDRYDKTVLPRCIFTCRSLQELNLKMGEVPEHDFEHEGRLLPDMINLPSLKKLTLCHVEVSTLDFKWIVARCPGLEDVHLINCAQHLELINSKVLKRLTIDGCIGGDEGLTIAAPELVHFECVRWRLGNISLQEQPSLESAHIDTCCTVHTFDGQSDFTGIFLHAKRLALCGSDIKATLEKELPSCSVFDNLVTLEIGGWCLVNDLYVVVRFLQLSPRLEKLTLKQRKIKEATKGAKTSSMPTPMPIDGMTFKCPLLETVIIQCSKDDDEIEKMVNAMVGHGIGLEKMQVIFYEDIERAERWGMSLEELNEHDILEKARNEKQKRADDTNAGRNEKRKRADDSNAGSDNNDDEEWMEDEYDDEDNIAEDEMEDEDDCDDNDF